MTFKKCLFIEALCRPLITKYAHCEPLLLPWASSERLMYVQFTPCDQGVLTAQIPKFLLSCLLSFKAENALLLMKIAHQFKPFEKIPIKSVNGIYYRDFKKTAGIIRIPQKQLFADVLQNRCS